MLEAAEASLLAHLQTSPTTGQPLSLRRRLKQEEQRQPENSRTPARKPKYTKEQYIWWLGGTGVMILGSVFMVMVSPDKGPWETPVNEPGLIGQVNQAGGTWKAGSSA